jgi:hypothetical protein
MTRCSHRSNTVVDVAAVVVVVVVVASVAAAVATPFMAEAAAVFVAAACRHFVVGVEAEASGPQRLRSAAEAVSVRARPLSAAASGAAPHSMAAAIDTRHQ